MFAKVTIDNIKHLKTQQSNCLETDLKTQTINVFFFIKLSTISIVKIFEIYLFPQFLTLSTIVCIIHNWINGVFSY